MTGMINEHRVETGRVVLSIRERDGGGPAIIALHDLGGNARWWDLVAGRLAPQHRVIAVDQRGHGLSDKPGDGYGFDDMVADLEALMQALDVPGALIAGHGWGASVALAFAADHPERVVGTICVDGGVFRLRDHFGDTWDLAAVAMAPSEIVGLTADRLARWVGASPLAEGSDAVTATEIVRGNLEAGGPAGELRPRLTPDLHMRIARALYDLDPEALLRRQRRPVLLLPAAGGDLDEARRRSVETGLADLGDRGHVIWTEGVHDLPLQRPEEIAAAIRKFADG